MVAQLRLHKTAVLGSTAMPAAGVRVGVEVAVVPVVVVALEIRLLAAAGLSTAAFVAAAVV